jgi:hypothetical protein
LPVYVIFNYLDNITENSNYQGWFTMAKHSTLFSPDYTIHPGEYLKEVLESRGIIIRGFAELQKNGAYYQQLFNIGK